MSNAYYSQGVPRPYELHGIGVFELESGDQIPGLKLAYATFGALRLQRRDRPVLSELLASPA
jgi:homoserine O-acetyltransferase/O-succinyltransferase